MPDRLDESELQHGKVIIILDVEYKTECNSGPITELDLLENIPDFVQDVLCDDYLHASYRLYNPTVYTKLCDFDTDRQHGVDHFQFMEPRVPELKPVFFPRLGTELTLTAAWSFHLYYEEQNRLFLLAATGLEYRKLPPAEIYDTTGYPRSIAVALFSDTTLKVEHINLRQDNFPRDSVLFEIRDSPGNEALKAMRFWARLDDVNKMQAVWKEAQDESRGDTDRAD